MNKQEFLNELKQRIDMLEDSEQQDILAEYAQHIDLRISGGLSEEEATRDFGDLNQLAGEILGAYHVKPDFQKAQMVSEPVTPPQSEPHRSTAASVGKKLKEAGSAVKAFFVRMGHGIGNWFHRVSTKVQSWFHRTPKSADSVQSLSKPKKNRTSWLVSLRSGWSQVTSWLGRTCILLLWLIWNFGLLVCAVPVVLITLAIVLGLGTLVILLFQGYPLIGVTVCALGVLLCCASLLGLGWTLIWHRPGKEDIFDEQAE